MVAALARASARARAASGPAHTVAPRHTPGACLRAALVVLAEEVRVVVGLRVLPLLPRDGNDVRDDDLGGTETRVQARARGEGGARGGGPEARLARRARVPGRRPARCCRSRRARRCPRSRARTTPRGGSATRRWRTPRSSRQTSSSARPWPRARASSARSPGGRPGPRPRGGGRRRRSSWSKKRWIASRRSRTRIAAGLAYVYSSVLSYVIQGRFLVVMALEWH